MRFSSTFEWTELKDDHADGDRQEPSILRDHVADSLIAFPNKPRQPRPGRACYASSSFPLLRKVELSFVTQGRAFLFDARAQLSRELLGRQPCHCTAGLAD